MLVVLWPGTRSTRMTSPPSASTMSRPTTWFARVVAALHQHGRAAPGGSARAACLPRTPPRDRPLRARPAPRRAPATSWIGRSSPFSRVTDASLLRPTTRRSQAARACGHQLDVAGMQQIEAAIGEADAQSLPPPFGEPLVEQRAVEDDLVFGRERRRRQQRDGATRRPSTVAVPRLPTTMAPAALAARTATSKSARAASITREHRHDRIAGARHVPHLHRIGRTRESARRARGTSISPSSLSVTSTACVPSSLIELHRGGGDVLVATAPRAAWRRPAPCGSA